MVIMLLTGNSGRADPVQEYELKSVFLYNFARFVSWPPSAFPDAQAPIVIGVLGADPFGPVLDRTIENEAVNGRRLIVRRFGRHEEIGDCHILFIGPSETARFEEHVAALRGRSVLTVADQPGAAQRGVMIRLITEQNRIRLRINLEEARAAGLTLSSKLLRPAEIVTTRKN